MNFGVYI